MKVTEAPEWMLDEFGATSLELGLCEVPDDDREEPRGEDCTLAERPALALPPWAME